MDRQVSEKNSTGINTKAEMDIYKNKNYPSEPDDLEYINDSKRREDIIYEHKFTPINGSKPSDSVKEIEGFNHNFGTINSQKLNYVERCQNFDDEKKVENILGIEEQNLDCETEMKIVEIINDSESTKNSIGIEVNKKYNIGTDFKLEKIKVTETSHEGEITSRGKVVESESALTVSEDSLIQTKKVDHYNLDRNYTYRGSEPSVKSTSDLEVREHESDEKDIYVENLDINCKVSGYTSENDGVDECNICNKSIIDRKDELKALKEVLLKQKEKLCHEIANEVTEKKICNGNLFRKDIFEDLLEYLIEKRTLKEMIFESDNASKELKEFECGNLEAHINNKNNKENGQLFEVRKTFFESLLKFSCIRMPVNVVFNNSVDNKDENSSNTAVKPFINLEKNSVEIIFMENCPDEVGNVYSRGLIPISHHKISKIPYNDINIEGRLEKTINNFRNISSFIFEPSCNEYIMESSFKDLDMTIENTIENAEIECKTDMLGTYFYNLIDIINNKLIRYQHYSLFPDNNEFLGISLDLNNITGNFVNYIPSEVIPVVIGFQERVESIYKIIGLKHEENSNSGLSIISRLMSLEKILNTTCSFEFQTNKLEKKLFMGSELLDGFLISDSRKSDLKKISNLVKSKVSSHIGRNINTSIEGNEYNLSEIEVCSKADSVEIKSIIDELQGDEENNLITLLDNLSCFWENIFNKYDKIEQYSKCIESMNNWEKIHRGNLNNIEKINNAISGFRLSIDSGIDLINSL
ncbi:hypothetical protein RS030_81301 [Cryptosporidium xiaoi]|uniref:Uncharacterized protein n=1 Tax=Cryptosporidium xiaoi TaxID=659607 RepID=A0AAV9XT19_9CRYT